MNYNKIISFTALLFFFFAPTAANAKHIIGGDITYEYLGDSPGGIKRWRFTMHVYRDCFGGGAFFDVPAQIAIYRGSVNNNSLYKSFGVSNYIYQSIKPDTPLCVTNLPSVCVEEATYVWEEALPVLTNESYFIVYQRCCRNETISNLINPGDVGATYAVELTPAAMANNNNSPVFKKFPPVIICNKLPLNIDHSAFDKDGDLLVYSFCPALNGGGNIVTGNDVYSCIGVIPTPPCPPPFDQVPYAVPTYNFNNPMGGDPPITINPVTGIITGTPTLLGQYVVTVCVQEYRNGQLLSTSRREFQFNIADCTPNISAKLASDSLTILKDDYIIKSCGNKTIFFQNKTTIAANVKDVEWRFDINGTTVSDTENFWFTAFTFPDTGTYKGLLLINQFAGGCSDTAKITVRIFPDVNAKFAYEYDTCVAGPVVFTDQSNGAGIIDQWKWNFGIPGTSSTQQHPSFLYPIPGNHTVNLRVIDRNQCTDDTTAVINWYPAPPIIIIQPNSYLGCAPADIFFDNLSSPIDNTYQIVWDFGDGSQTEHVVSPEHLYSDPGTYTVKVAITSPIGCYRDAEFVNLIRVEPSPIADFECDPMDNLSLFNNTVNFIDKSQGANRWNWQIGPKYTTTVQNPTYTFNDTGVVKIKLIVTHEAGCRDEMEKELDIKPEVIWFMPNAFTPNGDGKNDDFFGKGYLYGVTNFRMTIWNRWGEMVYETNNPNDKWNGEKHNSGGMSPEGVYIYLVTFTGPRGQPHEYKGFVTVVR